MTEQVPFNIIADVLTKLGSSAIQGIGSAFGVSKELTKLTKKLDTLNSVLVDAEKRQEESDAVKSWVRRLEDVVYDADDLLDDFETLQLQKQGGVARQVSDFFSSSNQLVLRFKMSNRVQNIKKEIDEIAKEIPMLSLIQGKINHKEAESSWRESHSFVLPSQIVGREENKREIVKLLVSSDTHEILSVVAIVGIGGLGKTTLAQLVYNDPRVVEYFELKRWVCVSDPFEVKSLVKKILKDGRDRQDNGDRLELNGLKDLLHETISQKRCLFVLDDVWNENYENWDQLKSLFMVVGKGSKILVTTRKSKVASVMGINSPFVLEGLKGTQPWDLFAKIAFTQAFEYVNPKLVEIGKEIVNMCNGVPLIIKTLGTVLRFKTEESQWLSIKNSDNFLSLRDENNNVLSILKLSYDNLPVHLKQCFAYCALFPKDYTIEKKSLVQMWMAHGYIQPSDEDLGDQYFEELLSRSLLEVFEKDAYDNTLCCKMHDLIHDLALSVIRSKVLILDDEVKKISQEVQHVLLFNPKILKLKALKGKRIRTFLSIPLQDPGDIPIQSFSNFKCLRVLSLNGLDLRKVPRSLGKLNHLRYLDLSFNWFTVLPNSISSLKNLQTMKLVHCLYLKELPKDIRKLINLRHLENDRCQNLSHMPCGIGELTMLQSLPIFVVGNRRGIGSLSELKGLNNLRRELRIEGLEYVGDAMVEPREANLGGKQHIQSLRLIWRHSEAQSSEDADSVLEGLQPHSNLKQLQVEGYGGGRFPSWMMNGGLSRMLPNLTIIYLRRCSSCHTLPCFAQLPHLRSLKLYNLGMMEYMEECSLEGPFFPSLQELTVHQMPKLNELWRMELPAQPRPSFPCLAQLRIEVCHDLASLELPPSPLLSHLDINSCFTLASLELHSSPLLSQLEIRNCHELLSLKLHSYPVLSKLSVSDCPKLTSLLLPLSSLLSQLDIKLSSKLASSELHSSPRLSKLNISHCHQLTSLLLPPSPHLSQIGIRRCDNLASLELQSSPSLSELEVLGCPMLTSLLLPPSPLLSQLEICNCDELGSLELHSSPLLSELYISCCPKLVFLLLPPSPHLSRLEMGCCDELGSFQLHSSPLLSEVKISFCPKLTSLQRSPSPSLSQLEIYKCDELASLEVSSFPCLKTLELAKVGEEVLRQLMSSTTASTLESVSISSIDELVCLPDELHRHVSTLQTLKIEGCSRLAMLPNWIGNLTSLTLLKIGYCPQLTSLPDEMCSLTTLETLLVFGCPYLSERCQREEGEDWPKIAHVPLIFTD